MKKTYVHISITYYSRKSMIPEVRYYYDDGNGRVIIKYDMTVDEANIRMWELIGMGGVNSYESNPYRSSISTREVVFWGDL